MGLMLIEYGRKEESKMTEGFVLGNQEKMEFLHLSSE